MQVLTHTSILKTMEKENGRRFNTCRVPRYNTELYDTAKVLYPEVDFNEFEPVHKTETFYTPQDEEDIKELYWDLIKYKYIAPDTEIENICRHLRQGKIL